MTANSAQLDIKHARLALRLAAASVDLFVVVIILLLTSIRFKSFFALPIAAIAIARIETSGSLGKRAMGLRVTDLEGTPLDFWHTLARVTARLLSVCTLGVGYLSCAWTQRRQSLHDLVCGTLVIETRSRSRIALVFSALTIAGVCAAVLGLAYHSSEISKIGSTTSFAALVTDQPFESSRERTINAQLRSGLESANRAKTAVETAVAKGVPLEALTGTTLHLSEVSDSVFVESIRLSGGILVITYGKEADPALLHRAIAIEVTIHQDQTVEWICGFHALPHEAKLPLDDAGPLTTVPHTFLPEICRA